MGFDLAFLSMAQMPKRMRSPDCSSVHTSAAGMRGFSLFFFLGVALPTAAAGVVEAVFVGLEAAAESALPAVASEDPAARVGLFVTGCDFFSL